MPNHKSRPAAGYASAAERAERLARASTPVEDPWDLPDALSAVLGPRAVASTKALPHVVAAVRRVPYPNMRNGLRRAWALERALAGSATRQRVYLSTTVPSGGLGFTPAPSLAGPSVLVAVHVPIGSCVDFGVPAAADGRTDVAAAASLPHVLAEAREMPVEPSADRLSTILTDARSPKADSWAPDPQAFVRIVPFEPFLPLLHASVWTGGICDTAVVLRSDEPECTGHARGRPGRK